MEIISINRILCQVQVKRIFPHAKKAIRKKSLLKQTFENVCIDSLDLIATQYELFVDNCIRPKLWYLLELFACTVNIRFAIFLDATHAQIIEFTCYWTCRLGHLYVHISDKPNEKKLQFCLGFHFSKCILLSMWTICSLCSIMPYQDYLHIYLKSILNGLIEKSLQTQKAKAHITQSWHVESRTKRFFDLFSLGSLLFWFETEKAENQNRLLSLNDFFAVVS